MNKIYREIRFIYILFREAIFHLNETSSINIETGEVIRVRDK